MKKMLLLILVCLFVFVSGCGNEKPVMILKMADVTNHGHPEVEHGDKYFAKLVEERTNGRIKIQVMPGGVLGQEKDAVRSLQIGGVDFVRVGSSTLSDFEPTIKVLMMPFLFENAEHRDSLLKGELGKTLSSNLYKSNGLVHLAWYDGGKRHFLNTKTAINTPSDTKGMKFRVNPAKINMEFIKSIGGSPISMGSNETYNALQSRMVDGAEMEIAWMKSGGLFDVVKYVTFSSHMMQPAWVLVSDKTWNKLSDEDKKIIKQAAIESSENVKKHMQAYEESAIKEAEKKGVKFNTISASNIKEWKKTVEPLYSNYPELNDLIKQVKESEKK